jgi:hypothetical protein
MTVPKALQPAITNTLSAILDDPNGEFGPLRRKTFFTTWHSLEESDAILAYQFLNVLAAEHVLPVYEGYEHLGWTNNWYHKEMPKRIIQIAKATITQEIAEDVSGDIAASYHMVIGNMADGMACNALIALEAAYSALSACSRYTPLSEFERLSRIAFVGAYKVNTSTGELEKQEVSAIRGEQFSDMDWAKSGKSDTAAAAAIAWSCAPDTYQPHVDKLKSFWEWWFNTAIPEAWSMMR